ncbi:SDR family oxidoreductase [Alkalihalobacillus oceani]|uniref:SDR family oxidoreductase n=1 Tax=Halalkalibacter oceani TaxID=1653776 RepID=A0A9X2INP3_9BACI|nr:SDR family NAD(P)-dependent oxidoreductase [Halalkalibacter oceani]MCM3715114.1 SDR family oxidoreductase [Halalkalibacter oceani]
MTIFSTFALAEQHALVTGATGGIGAETAKVLAGMGAAITISGRRRQKLNALKQEIEQQVPDASIYVHAADLTNAEQRDELCAAAKDELGPISILVNSAGVSGGSVVERLTQDDMERIMHINYTSTVLLTQQVYRQMKEKGHGAIINVASLSGLRGTYGNTAYAASKFALIGFTHSFALEAIEHHVRVNAVCPGYVETDMALEAIRRKAAHSRTSFEHQMTKAKESIPSGHFTSPQDVANTIAFLASAAADNIIGESVKISGGSVLR